MTSKNIMKMTEGKTYTFYRAACSCGHVDDDITLSIAATDLGTVELEIYTNSVSSDNYYRSDYSALRNWWSGACFRLNAALRIIFTGYHKTETLFVMNGDEQINEFIAAIREGQKKIQLLKDKE